MSVVATNLMVIRLSTLIRRASPFTSTLIEIYFSGKTDHLLFFLLGKTTLLIVIHSKPSTGKMLGQEGTLLHTDI